MPRVAKEAEPVKPGPLNPEQPKLLTRADLARRLGVAPGRVNKWASDGCPIAVPGRRGVSAMYDLAAVQRWRADRGASAGEDVSLGAARARVAIAQAEKLERENRLRSGELVEREAVIREGQAVLASLRARLLALPRQAVNSGALPRDSEPALHGLIVDTLRDLARGKFPFVETEKESKC